jgi:two-component system, chemotaxis family, sensor kinase CheA
MDDIVKDFLIESGENLDRLDQELVQLEADPRSKDLLASIFRTIHTIKGSCGFLGFARLEKVAHAGESLLSRLRDGELDLTAEITSGLLAMVDAVRQMLGEIHATEHDGENDYPELLEMLKGLQETASQSSATPAATNQSETNESGTNELGASSPEATAFEASRRERGEAPPAELEPGFDPVHPERLAAETRHTPPQGRNRRPAAGRLGGALVERGRISADDLVLALAEQERGDQRRLGEILVALGLCRPDDITSALQAAETRAREADETVRIGVNLLDRLMNLVGELVLARNQLLQFSSSNLDSGFQAISQRLNRIAGELQEEVMKTRMQPIGNVWNKFPRTVRDLALSCGKKVKLEMQGQDTELDRTILEAVKDPLTHLVRNSVDHGIEAPRARLAAGKSETGCLRLRAFHESGQVNLEISDDGAGLNLERIRSKAIERGLVPAQQADRMSDREIYDLIFLPGFSTAEKITNVSGRGVGMDVVRTNLEKIGGTVDLQSTRGAGTTVRIKIPLTLAIVPALVVRCLGERFAIPQMSLTELVRLESGQSIERVHGAPVYRLRGQLLPLVYLREVLSGAPTAAESEVLQAESVNIVVLQAGSRHFGVVVEDILDTEEIVVKPLGKQLKSISIYAGATIMGDGSVALILDVMALAQRAGIVTESREPAADEKSRLLHAVGGLSERQALLLAENGVSGRVAIPLRTVARLEEFPATVIEYAGTRPVMQYRGQIIPLIRLSDFVATTGDAGLEERSSIRVVVYSEGAFTAGLIVERIVDIVEQSITVDSVNPRPGITGTCVVDKRVTDVLDVPAIVRSAIPEGLLPGLESPPEERVS